MRALVPLLLPVVLMACVRGATNEAPTFTEESGAAAPESRSVAEGSASLLRDAAGEPEAFAASPDAWPSPSARGVLSARISPGQAPRWTGELVAPDLPGELREGGPCAADHNCPSPLRCRSGRCELPAAMRGVADASILWIDFIEADRPERFALEVARGAREQARGLMDRDWMFPGFGMIFSYPREQQLSFWMRNTHIPLDMIFLNGALEVVHVEAMAEPLSETPRTSERPAQHVVELVGGEAERIGIEVGQRVELWEHDRARPLR